MQGPEGSRRRRDEGPIHDVGAHEDQEVEEDYSDKLIGKYCIFDMYITSLSALFVSTF